MEFQTLKKFEEPDWEFYDYVATLEKEWRASSPRLTNKELLEIYPEAKSIIPKKIKERKQEMAALKECIKQKLAIIQNEPNENARIFWREWLKVNEGEDLLVLIAHIQRLKGLLMSSKGYIPKGWISEDQKQRALAIPLETLLQQSFRKSGKTLTGLCPFHDDRRPSFFIYLESNTCWCFACNKGGDSIALMRLLHGYSFKEAVINLVGQ